MTFTLDTTVNIEALLAALGLFGAAIAYIASTFSRLGAKKRDTWSRGVKFVIMNLLECNARTGLSISELWRLYNNEDTSILRIKYKATPPNKLDAVDFERELKSLQVDFLIDLTDTSKYVIRVRSVTVY